MSAPGSANSSCTCEIAFPTSGVLIRFLAEEAAYAVDRPDGDTLPDPFMAIVKEDLGEHLCTADGGGNGNTSGEKPGQEQGIQGADDAPGDALDGTAETGFAGRGGHGGRRYGVKGLFRYFDMG